MMYPRLAALGGAASLALCGFVQAAPPAHPSLAPSPALTAAAGAEPIQAGAVPAHPAALRADAVQVAVNTLGGPLPVARSAAVAATAVPQDAFSSYLVSATRYVQDVGTFWSPSDVAPKKISEVPLPGALWLFGSALLAFLAISVRRKF